MLENKYQQELKKKIKDRIPGCFVLKNDPTDIQGFPDLSIHYRGRVAYLEVKKSQKEKKQPNQEYYIDVLGKEAFASFIFPENEKETLDAMERSLGIKR